MTESVAGVRVRATLDQQPGHLQTFPQNGQVQRRPLSRRLPLVHRCALIEQL